MRTRRTTTAAVAGAALLLTLGACGGDDPARASAEASGSPSASTPASPSESPSASTSGSTDAEPADGAAEGPLDEDTLLPAMKAALEDETSVHLAMELDGGAQGMTAEGDVTFQGPESDLAMTMRGDLLGGNVVELRKVGTTMYVSMPPMTPAGRFVEVRPGDDSNPLSGMLDRLGTDPRDTFDAFEAGLRSVGYVGEESVAGEELDRYRLTVDFEAAAKAQGMDLPRGAAGIPETVDYDMWLDEDDLMRRVTLAVAGQQVVMTMSDWGKPVTVEAPPARLLVRPKA